MVLTFGATTALPTCPESSTGDAGILERLIGPTTIDQGRVVAGSAVTPKAGASVAFVPVMVTFEKTMRGPPPIMLYA